MYVCIMIHLQGLKNSEDAFMMAFFYFSQCTECFTISFPQMERKSSLDLVLRCEILIPEKIQITFVSPPGFQPNFCRWRSGCYCGVIAPIPVTYSNTLRPVRPPCSVGARRGSQSCNKQEEPRRDLGKKGHFPQASENVWSDALNYWGQRLPPLGRFVSGCRRQALTLEGVVPPLGTGNGKTPQL